MYVYTSVFNLLMDAVSFSDKTESIKALGVQLGVFVLIFCCDETFDFLAIFIGPCHVASSSSIIHLVSMWFLHVCSHLAQLLMRW